jgi:hypothetical protein
VQVPIILESEFLRICLVGVLAVLTLLYLLLAGCSYDKINTRRFRFTAIAAFAITAVAVVTQVCFVLLNIGMYSLIPGLIAYSVYIAVAAASLLLLHWDDGKEYEGLDGATVRKEEDELEIERASSSDEGAGFDEDED